MAGLKNNLVRLLSICLLAPLVSTSFAQQAKLQVQPDTLYPWVDVAEASKTTLRIAPIAAPRIDGRLNDPSWKSTSKIDTFSSLGGVPADAEKWVTLQAGYDEKHLYLSGTLAKPGPTLRATVKENYGRIWADDALEIFIHDRQTGTLYQIDINANGAWWAGSKQTWKPSINAAGNINANDWTFELAVPWSDLGLSTPGARPFGIQFRYLVNGQSGFTMWQPAPREQPAAFSEIEILDSADNVISGDAAAGLIVTRYFQRSEQPIGSAAGSVGVELYNPSKKSLGAQLRVTHVTQKTLDDSSTPVVAKTTLTKMVQVPAGQRLPVLLEAGIPEDDPGTIRQTVWVFSVDEKSGKPRERFFHRTRTVVPMVDFDLAFQREHFYFGEKGVQGTLNIGIPEAVLAKSNLHVEFGTRRRIVSEKKFDQNPPRRLSLFVDFAGLPPDDYQLIATLDTGERVYEKVMPLTLEQAMPLPDRQRVPIRINMPDGWVGGMGLQALPLYAGVSFPGGMLSNLNNVRLVSSGGREVPVQIQPLAHWGPAGSIRWAGINFLGNPDEEYFIEFGSTVERKSVAQLGGPAITINKQRDVLQVETGPARFDVPLTGPLLGSAWLRGQKALEGGQPCLIVADQNSNIATELGGPEEESPVVETAGPLHAVIRREGFLRKKDGSTLGKYVVRLAFNAGSPVVDVQHSFINTEDTMQVQYSDLAVRVKPAFDGSVKVAMDSSPEPTDDVTQLRIDPSNGDAAYMAQTVYYHHRQPEKKFTIGVNRGSGWQEAKSGEACGEWLSVSPSTGRVGVAVTMRNFVEMFPSELEISGDGITAHMWSSRGGRMLDYRASTLVDYLGREWFDYGSEQSSAAWKSGADGFAAVEASAAGTSRTTDLSIHLFGGSVDHHNVHKVAQLANEPPLAIQDPTWLRKTQALGPLSPYDPEKFPRAERFIESFFKYHLVGQAEHWGNYGFLDHGSGPHGFHTGSHDYRERRYPLLKRVIHFDYKFRSTPWRMYARSGDRMYFDYGDAKNRHIADFRWVHHPSRGLRKGAMIISETSLNLPLYWVSQENLGFQGQDIDNFLYQYYLTGDRWVNETVQQFGDYMIEHFDPYATKPVGDMYNYQPYMFLASLYEKTWDERLGDKLRAMRWTLDKDTSTGLMDWPTMSAWYKWYIEVYGPLRDYMVTGSNEAKQTFLKLAELYISHPPAGRHESGNTMGYDDNYGLVMNIAWQMTGDDRYAMHARENLSRRLFWFSEESGETHRVGPWEASHSAQGLDSYAYLMDVVDRMPDDLPRHPAIDIGRNSPAIDFYFVKPRGQASKLQMVTGSNFDINLTQLADRGDKIKRLGTFKLTTWPTYSAKDRRAGLANGIRFTELQLPKEAMPGQYRLTDVSEVSFTDVQQIVAYAPNGIALAAADATPSSWYFMLPAGKTGAIQVDKPVVLEIGDRKIDVSPGSWHELAGGEADQLVRLVSARTGYDPFPFKQGRGHVELDRFIDDTIDLQFKGSIPPIITQHDPERFFIPRVLPSASEGEATANAKPDKN